ncbi:MAG: GNAT family N-acetyltransferase [Pseudomonadota bacterium]
MSVDLPLQVQQLIKLAKTLRKQATAGFQRRMLVLSGGHSWCISQAKELLTHLSCANPYWVGDSAPMGLSGLTNADALSLLGSETETFVYDAYTGFDPDAFGAMTGTLLSGGILILLTPKLSEWSAYPDPEHERIAVAGATASDVTGRFLGRLSRLIRNDSSIFCFEQGGDVPSPPEQVSAAISREPFDAVCRTEDQAIAVDAVVHVVTGHRQRPVVLISDRGRGKSSALGIAAARLISSGRKNILVTAPRQASTQSLFAQATHSLSVAKTTPGSLHMGESSITYHAPDHLLQHPQPADLLLVDEAAAIPTPLLEALLDHYPRIAFATTIHGYEGTGRGFALRFRQVLDQRFPHWREVRLETPIRWAADDPLEKWLFSALALNASPAPDDLIAGAQPDRCTLEILDRERLVKNERDLTDLFGLLVLAHYRTTPFDLRHLLDGPNLTVFCLRYRGRILATALVAQEGGFDPATAHAIWSGYRRPRGHLLAQSLAAHIGLEAGASLHGARIMRIAVHPLLQQRGLGSRLVQEILHHSQTATLDYLGASFGATPELLRFWSKHRLLPVRVGLRRGASSGTQSVIMLHPITAVGAQIFDIARQRFTQQLHRLLGDALNTMDPGLACALLAHTSQSEPEPPDRYDWLDLIGFAFAHRGYEISLPAIEQLTLRALGESKPEPADAQLLLMKVLQNRDWPSCAKRFKLAGRAAVEELLRKVIGQLVLHYADSATYEIAVKIQTEQPV